MIYFFKYFVLIFLIFIGILLVSSFGPASGLLYDWDMSYPSWLSSYVYAHQNILLIFVISTIGLFCSQLLTLSYFKATLCVHVFGYFAMHLETIRVGDYSSLIYYLNYVDYLKYFTIGMLLSVGLWFLTNKVIDSIATYNKTRSSSIK